MARRMTPDRLIAELQAHVAEIAADALGGDYDARQWLCESFQGHTAYFHALWSAPAQPAKQSKIQVRL